MRKFFVYLGGPVVAGAAMPALAASPPRIEFVDPLAAAAMAGRGNDLSPVGMFQSADWVVQAVIIVLLLASFVTWTICIAKFVELRRERRRLGTGLGKLRTASGLADADDLGYAPLADMIVNAEDEIAASGRLSAAMPGEGVKDRIALRLERLEGAMRRRASKGLAVLAIIGSVGPFVGLFGTVWGIMNSFIGIARSHTTNLAVVAPGIAEALLTTAMGLVAAIPAVVIYNLLSRELSGFRGEMGDATVTVLCLAGREIDHAAGA